MHSQLIKFCSILHALEEAAKSGQFKTELPFKHLPLKHRQVILFCCGEPLSHRPTCPPKIIISCKQSPNHFAIVCRLQFIFILRTVTLIQRTNYNWHSNISKIGLYPEEGPISYQMPTATNWTNKEDTVHISAFRFSPLKKRLVLGGS